MDDSKDRLGKKLQEREKAAEDSWIAEQEKAKLEKLRREQAASSHPAICPKCAAPLRWVRHHGVCVDECPNGHGVWIATEEIETLAQRERDGWVGRYFFQPKLVTD
ncbi:MAG: zf-TFIIB domain-containing protein [bacterium]|nr:zf-TFIIB domain-containing protein [bacterium]